MDFLKKFNTETQYDVDVENFEYATVSYIEDIEEVRYMEKPLPYSEQYLTFEALEDGTFTFTKIVYNIYGSNECLTTEDFTNLGYSLDNGNTWTMLINNGITEVQTITTPTISAGNRVIWKGISQRHYISGGGTRGCYFSSTGNYNVSGNIMSLLYGDDFRTNTILPQPISTGTNRHLALGPIFANSSKLISAQNLILPTTLVEGCFHNMFQTCTSLTTAPSLPSTTLADSCYSAMFQGCSSLTTVSELPATTLVRYCYNCMFMGCTVLNYIKMMATDVSALNALGDWVQGVASTGTFVKNSAAQWDVSGADGVPTGWTVQTASE